MAIEPWVHYGFQLAQYAVGWVPYVGWLSPQIDIFYHFGERIVRSVVFNSADWLWGPLPFAVGLGNIARDSWNSLVQLGIDQWNFWLPSLPPLPPFPFAARQAQPQSAAAETLVPSVQQVAPGTDETGSTRPGRTARSRPRGIDLTSGPARHRDRSRRTAPGDARKSKGRLGRSDGSSADRRHADEPG